MAAFGRALPKIRAQVDADLRKRDLTHDKVVATVVRLLELTLISASATNQYARDKQELRPHHPAHPPCEERGRGLDVRVQMARAAWCITPASATGGSFRIIKALQAIPGQRLFQYVDEAGERHAVGSHDVNGPICRRSPARRSRPRIFRTLGRHHRRRQGASPCSRRRAARRKPSASPPFASRPPRAFSATPPAVCRSAYIHPAVFEAFAARSLPRSFAKAEGPAYERRRSLKFLDAAGEDDRGQDGQGLPERSPRRRRDHGDRDSPPLL